MFVVIYLFSFGHLCIALRRPLPRAFGFGNLWNLNLWLCLFTHLVPSFPAGVLQCHWIKPLSDLGIWLRRKQKQKIKLTFWLYSKKETVAAERKIFTHGNNLKMHASSKIGDSVIQNL